MDNRKYLQKIAGEMSMASMLHSIREEMGLSQSELGKLLDVSPKQISDIENGRRPVSLSRAAKWAAVLGYPEPVFLGLAVNDSLRREGLNYVATLRVG